ncbi:MAG: DinB family protein [Ginsengibacter sp.]
MDTVFRFWKTSRQSFLYFFDKYTFDQLNKIPEGFSNNLIWNIGHIIIVQQALIYKNTGLEGYIPGELYSLYKPGTKPTENTSQQEVDNLKELLLSLIEKTQTDYLDKKFGKFNEKTVGTGFYLSSLEDALEFNNYHEGLHLGYMTNIKKFV